MFPQVRFPMNSDYNFNLSLMRRNSACVYLINFFWAFVFAFALRRRRLNTALTRGLPITVCRKIRFIQISSVFICNFFRGRSSSSSVKKQCVQRISQTDVTRMFNKIGANGCPIASFAYLFNNSLVVKSIFLILKSQSHS